MQIDMSQSFLTGPRFVIAGTGALLSIPPKDEVLIGRADPCDIDLSTYGGSTAGVSRQHARLLRKDDGWAIEDLRSTNGTYVNDQRLTPHQPIPLNDGDNVQCGKLAMTFHAGESQ
jgi:pSer/pThr/pTyr-binding forkhead associated (FHA) protein